MACEERGTGWTCLYRNIKDNKSYIFQDELKTANLSMGIYHFNCTANDSGIKLFALRVVLRNGEVRLDCAASLSVIHLIEQVDKYNFCVWRQDIHPEWYKIPDVIEKSILPAKCRSKHPGLKFVQGTLHIVDKLSLVNKKVKVECGGGLFQKIVSFLLPLEGIIGAMGLQRFSTVGIDFFNVYKEAQLYDFNHTFPSIMCLYSGEDSSMKHELNWSRLHGKENFLTKVFYSTSVTRVDLLPLGQEPSQELQEASFLCRTINSATCSAKLLIYSRAKFQTEITFSRKDRIQSFDSTVNCLSDGSPKRQLELSVDVLLGSRQLFKRSHGSIKIEHFSYVNAPLLIRCTARQRYLGHVYNSLREDVFFRFALKKTLTFDSNETYFARNATLKCVFLEDMNARPYIQIMRFPQGFVPKKYYNYIEIDSQFVVGRYDLRCYYFPPFSKKRIISKTIYHAVMPTKIVLRSVVKPNKMSAIICETDGFPAPKLSIKWVFLTKTPCCLVNKYSHLMLAPQAYFGLHRLRCMLNVSHPLGYISLSRKLNLHYHNEYFAHLKPDDRHKLSRLLPFLVLIGLWTLTNLLLFLIVTYCVTRPETHTSKYSYEKYKDHILLLDLEPMPTNEREYLVQLLLEYDILSCQVGRAVAYCRATNDWSIFKSVHIHDVDHTSRLWRFFSVTESSMSEADRSSLMSYRGRKLSTAPNIQGPELLGLHGRLTRSQLPHALPYSSRTSDKALTRSLMEPKVMLLDTLPSMRKGVAVHYHKTAKGFARSRKPRSVKKKITEEQLYRLAAIPQMIYTNPLKKHVDKRWCPVSTPHDKQNHHER